MGVGPFSSRSHRYAPYTEAAPVTPNPDPRRFSIKSCDQFGKLFVSTIIYAGCTNFEGRKVLVTKFDPRRMKVLDPHFEPGAGIIARFEPSLDGHMAAIAFAEMWAKR